MAREMNIDKRVETLRSFVTWANARSARATKIATELSNTFKGDKSPKGKNALQAAQAAKKLAGALEKVASSVSL